MPGFTPHYSKLLLTHTHTQSAALLFIIATEYFVIYCWKNQALLLFNYPQCSARCFYWHERSDTDCQSMKTRTCVISSGSLWFAMAGMLQRVGGVWIGLQAAVFFSPSHSAPLKSAVNRSHYPGGFSSIRPLTALRGDFENVELEFIARPLSVYVTGAGKLAWSWGGRSSTR